MTGAVAILPQRVPLAGTVLHSLRRMGADAPTYTAMAVLLTLAIVPTLVAGALDPRTTLGANVWTKPLKFEIALALYFATLAVFARFVSPGVRASWPHRLFVGIVALATVYEMVWIVGSAALGVPSHFNLAHPLLEGAYGLAGAAAVTLTAASLVTGLAVAANRNTGLPPALKWSIAAGLVLTFVSTVFVAGYLAGRGGHFVGGEGVAATTWPLFGWATDRGDLRVAHFFATHALHALPLVGLAAAAIGGRARGLALVAAATVAYAGLVAYAFLEATAGRPFLSMLSG